MNPYGHEHETYLIIIAALIAIAIMSLVPTLDRHLDVKSYSTCGPLEE